MRGQNTPAKYSNQRVQSNDFITNAGTQLLLLVWSSVSPRQPLWPACRSANWLVFACSHYDTKDHRVPPSDWPAVCTALLAHGGVSQHCAASQHGRFTLPSAPSPQLKKKKKNRSHNSAWGTGELAKLQRRGRGGEEKWEAAARTTL